MKVNKTQILKEDDNLEQEIQQLPDEDKEILTDIINDGADIPTSGDSEPIAKADTSRTAQTAAKSGVVPNAKKSDLHYDYRRLDGWLENAGKIIVDDEEKLPDVLDAIYNVNNANVGMDTDTKDYGDEPGPYISDFDPSEYQEDDFDYAQYNPDADPDDDYDFDDEGNKTLRHDNSQPLNLLCVGTGGAGKTSIIERWVHKKKLNYLELIGSELDAAYIKGIPFHITDKDKDGNVIKDYVKNLNNTKFDPLDYEGQAVLFIDEINRSYSEARAALLKIIQSHKIPDANSKTGDRPLKNLLFVVAAMNPPSDEYEGAAFLDIAMLTRFAIYSWESDPKETLKWYLGVCKRRLNRLWAARQKGYLSNEGYVTGVRIVKGRRNLAVAILTDPSFRFSTNKEEVYAKEHQLGVLNARTITSSIDASDGTVNGTLLPNNGFRTWYKRFCGSHLVPSGSENPDGTAEMIDDEMTQIMDIILADVEDAEDENNAAFKTPAQLIKRYLQKQGVRV